MSTFNTLLPTWVEEVRLGSVFGMWPPLCASLLERKKMYYNYAS